MTEPLKSTVPCLLGIGSRRETGQAGLLLSPTREGEGGRCAGILFEEASGHLEPACCCPPGSIPSGTLSICSPAADSGPRRDPLSVCPLPFIIPQTFTWSQTFARPSAVLEFQIPPWVLLRDHLRGFVCAFLIGLACTCTWCQCRAQRVCSASVFPRLEPLHCPSPGGHLLVLPEIAFASCALSTCVCVYRHTYTFSSCDSGSLSEGSQTGNSPLSRPRDGGVALQSFSQSQSCPWPELGGCDFEFTVLLVERG